MRCRLLGVAVLLGWVSAPAALLAHPGHDHRQRFVVWKSHAASARQILLKGGFDRLAQIHGGEGILGRPARTVELATQTRSDLVSKSRFGAAIADAGKLSALFRKFLNRLLYLVEIGMRFDGHALGTISAGSGRSVQQVYHSLSGRPATDDSANKPAKPANCGIAALLR